MAETVRTFIDSLNGNATVAKATGHTEGAVALWVHRNRLPRSAWPEVMTAFPEVTLKRLMDLETACLAEAANDGNARGEAA